MLSERGRSWSDLVAFQEQWYSVEIQFILARDRRINCSLLYVLKNAAGRLLATDNTHVHTQSALPIFVWNLVANELMQNGAKSLLTNQTQVESAQRALAAAPQVETHFLFSSSFSSFRVLILSFPRRRRKVVSQATRPKDLGSLHGRIQCDLWACRAGLSGAPREQTARKPPSCSRPSQARDLGSCFCVERHLLWQAERPRGFLCNKPSRHPHSVLL